MIPKQLILRFNEKYERHESGCWLWTASTAGKGYGQIKLPKQRKQIYAHQLSYLIYKGEIPAGVFVCHTCDNPKCVNPDHLFLGSAKDNQQDMKAKGRSTFGERNPGVKLTEERVQEVLRLLRDGVTQMRIAKMVGISQMQVSRINRGERWNHLNSSPVRPAVARKRLGTKEIKQVRTMIEAGTDATRIAPVFGCSVTTVRRIRSGLRWSHIK